MNRFGRRNVYCSPDARIARSTAAWYRRNRTGESSAAANCESLTMWCTPSRRAARRRWTVALPPVQTRASTETRDRFRFGPARRRGVVEVTGHDLGAGPRCLLLHCLWKRTMTRNGIGVP